MGLRTVNRERAVLLRKLGWSYKQISKYIGCSEAWCAVHLSNIKPDDELMQKVAEDLLEKLRG